MFCQIVLVSLVLTAFARPDHVAVTQDTAGNYKLVYELENIARNEQRNPDGTLTGTYSYIDPNGQTQQISYNSGAHGFVASGSGIPQPVAYSPEVAQARNAHFATYQEVLKNLPITEEFDQSGKVITVPIPQQFTQHHVKHVPVQQQFTLQPTHQSGVRLIPILQYVVAQ